MQRKRSRFTFLAMTMAALIAFAAVSAWASAPAKGELFLVGLGAGDPDNMTLRAHKTIAKASVIFAMKGTAEKYAEYLKGKDVHDAGHGMFGGPTRGGKNPAELEAQREKTRRIIREAVAAGKTVAVLDNGDPMIFGPQTCYLREFADLNPTVVPGLSSFNAANAALRTGVTNGKASHSVVLTAARGGRGGGGGDSLAKLAESQSTMVFFTMGLDLPEVVRQLKQSYPGDTPIAIVSNAGTAGKEAVLKSTLDEIVAKLGNAPLPFEHLIYVGDFLK
ncbi:Precorrin-4 methylase [Humidesulfovibrio mexicanus]|uniref:Precorrin-4 methylase n=1 Tax=Humidesulfovibrio mexicanus TaxID=147047 RepID=A0A239A694_9BACT|nr:SAM-dependent methyltransferase [Humidesulfovibrio mexicanus]SNR90962.1 Precorrin-4 methylase [Humidesulfovibrio mexicanus]